MVSKRIVAKMVSNSILSVINTQFVYQISKWQSYSIQISVLGINIFLDGFVPTENLRFREASLTFKVSETAEVSFSFCVFHLNFCQQCCQLTRENQEQFYK